MKKPDFEDYLKGVHSGECGLPDDDQPDDFVRWTEDELDYDEMIRHANIYASQYAEKIDIENQELDQDIYELKNKVEEMTESFEEIQKITRKFY